VTASLPFVGRDPSQAPAAAQEVAFVTFQARFELAPWRIEPGVAVKVIVGTACRRAIVALAVADPPAPVQVKM
jgi:hypothetical protein